TERLSVLGSPVSSPRAENRREAERQGLGAAGGANPVPERGPLGAVRYKMNSQQVRDAMGYPRTRSCEDCGAEIENKRGRRLCAPCRKQRHLETNRTYQRAHQKRTNMRRRARRNAAKESAQ